MHTSYIVSWHPLLTDHQAYTLEALSHAINAPVTVNAAEEEDAVRKAQGWTATEVKSLHRQLIPKAHWLNFARSQFKKRREAVHLFSSPFEQPRLMFVLFLAVRMGLRVYIVSEPYSPIGVGYLYDQRKMVSWFKSHLRPWIYRLYSVLLKRRLAGVFAISPLAVAQYRSIGIPPEKIFPFGYFVPATVPVHPDVLPPETFRIIFVGNLIVRKGLDLLIDAIKKLHAEGIRIQVDVFGYGNPDLFAFDDASVRYAGKIPFGSAQSVIAKYGLLVLPSRYDGWGVVVNEALLAGVPVVCSNRVGAGAVVERWGCGRVYDSQISDALCNTLRSIVLNPDEQQRMRRAALAVRPVLDPAIAGEYMANVIESFHGTVPVPACPWYGEA